MIVGEGEMNERLMALRQSFPQAASRRRRSSARVGAPDGALTTPMSFMNTPRLKPVPTALEKASLAAKRLAIGAGAR